MNAQHCFRSGFVGRSLAICVATFGTFSLPVQAVQLANGTVYFNHPPRLLGARTTEKSIRVWGAKYYFTLRVPADAGEPLQRVAIAQREGVDNIRFRLKDTQAFVGEGRRQPLSLGAVTFDQPTQAVSVTFNPPVPPGQTVTVRLVPRRNPDVSGVYLFGVTALPAGEKVSGQFLGFGRLHFYDSFNGFGSFWNFR